MAALATREELEARLGRVLAGDEATRADTLLEDASAIVRGYTGQQFDAVAGETVRLRARAGVIRLPQRPVSAVTGVVDVDGNAVAFTHIGGDRVEVAAVDGWYDVTYDHGYAAVPGEVKAVVCQIAGRALGSAPDETGYQSETIEGYSYALGSAAAQGAAGLLAGEREVLDRYRRRVGSIMLGRR